MMIIGCDFHTRYQQIARGEGGQGNGNRGQTERFLFFSRYRKCARRDGFRTFLGEFLPLLQQSELPSEQGL
jgi:hypothetical protein